MSLLEDIFLQDETEEAQALERVIDGGEYEDQENRSYDGRSSAEEAEEDKRRVDPTKEKIKRVIKNPRFVLNPARLTGPRGIQVIPDHFKDFKFKGKGHERDDLDIILKRLEHWAYRLYPKFKYEDCLKKIETLGKKRPVMVHLHKIRSDQLTLDEPVVQRDSSDEEPPMPEEDEFDKLLQQQITIARSTPVQIKDNMKAESTRSLMTTSQLTPSSSMTEEQKERMKRNHELAKERRLARMRLHNNHANQTQITFENRNEILQQTNERDDSSVKNSQKNNDNHKKGSTAINRDEEINELDSSNEQRYDSNIRTILANVHATNNDIIINNEIEGNKIQVIEGVVSDSTTNDDLIKVAVDNNNESNKMQTIDEVVSNCTTYDDHVQIVTDIIHVNNENENSNLQILDKALSNYTTNDDLLKGTANNIHVNNENESYEMQIMDEVMSENATNDDLIKVAVDNIHMSNENLSN